MASMASKITGTDLATARAASSAQAHRTICTTITSGSCSRTADATARRASGPS
jgi:hypothetical protein